MKITLCIDKQARNNPSSELRQYSIDIGCPLRSIDTSFDELKISTDDNNKLVGKIIRRCYVDKYGVLKKLDTEETQELEIPEITLFEGSNYVYIKEFTNLNMKIEYLTNAEMNKYFASKVEMNTTIKQTYDEIMLSVSAKVGEDEIISKINMSPETISILANKLGLTANDVLNIIADNEINLTSKNISITSENFNVDTLGKVILKDAGDGLTSNFRVEDKNNSSIYSILGSSWIIMHNTDTSIALNTSLPYLSLSNTDSQTTITANKVSSPLLEQTSLESKKKNFESFNKGLELITSSDFYLYNLKTEEDGTKKHIGLVIGKNYNTPVEFINKTEDGIDLYSLISACGDAIKTLNNRIIELEKQVKEMK